MRLEIRQTGFTLIELLVVIAVIGILASVVLASLNSARTKGADAKIKSELKQIATALELWYDKNGSYYVTGSGNHNAGWGWVTYKDSDSGGVYNMSIAQKLANEGFLGTGFKNETNYILYICTNAQGQQYYSLSATLNNPTTADIAHIQTVCSSELAHDHYGKNYAIGN